MRRRTMTQALNEALHQVMEAHPEVFCLGEDIGKMGGDFGVTRGLWEKFGGERVRDTPLSEAAIIGAAVGAGMVGMRPVAEIMIADHITTCYDQIVNNAAKIRYRWGAPVPMVVRMPYGGLRSAGPFHSQDTSPWFYRTPGLKIVAPSTPHDARALLRAAVADQDPVLYYEHIALYRDPRIKQLLPEEAPEVIPLGKAALRRAGPDLLMISYGAYVHHCLRVANTLARDGIEASVLDLRSLAPLDRERGVLERLDLDFAQVVGLGDVAEFDEGHGGREADWSEGRGLDRSARQRRR